MIAVYSVVRDRLDMTRKSFKALRRMAGCEFDHYVADNGSDKETTDYLKAAKAHGHIKYLKLNSENIGQNLAANHLLDQMDDKYDWILRWDNDAMPRSRRFLKKMVSIGNTAMDSGAAIVLSPQISKLKHPPDSKMVVEIGDKDFDLVGILGGICRLHPGRLFSEWRFSKFGPLGFGEAEELGKLCAEVGIHMLRAPHLEVEHMYGEDGQIERHPDEFTWARREIGRYVSFGL